MFANQVRDEVLANSGIDIGRQKNYWDTDDANNEVRGLVPTK